MSRLFPPPPFFVFLIQHPLVPTYVPHASFVLPVLTEFSDVGACSKGCGLALAKLFLSAAAPLVEAGVPSVQFYLGWVCFLEALACGAGGWFSPGHAAVGAGDLELHIGLNCLKDFFFFYCGHRIAWQVEES